MFRTETISDLSNLNRWIDTTNRLPQQIEAVSQRVHQRNGGGFLAALQVKPRVRNFPADYPLEWESERQRRAYWASDGFGKGIPSKRSDAMIKAFVISLLPTANGTTINVKNRKPYSEYVIGKLRRRGRNRRQRMHIKGGWQDVSLTMDIWTRNYRNDFADEWRNLYD